MTIGAYKLTDAATGKYYIGSSQNVEKRYQRHLNELRRRTHHCLPMQLAWIDGAVFELEIFEESDREKAYSLEQVLLTLSKDDPLLLNVGLSAKGGDNLSRNPHREEIVSKIAEVVKKRFAQMPEDIRKECFGRAGEKNGMYGKKHTPEAVAKIKQSHIGRVYKSGYTPNYTQDGYKRLVDKAKMRVGELNSFYGKKHSEETKKLLSQKLKGRKPINQRKVSVNGTEYSSLTEASRQVGISPALMLHRLKSKRYTDYFYVLNA